MPDSSVRFAVNHDSGVPLYLQVEKILRQLIDLPEYRKGRLLPNEQDLSKRLGISRNTVRQAANKLVYEGLIKRKKGVGTRVTGNSVSTRLDNWESFTQEMSDKGIPFKNFSLNTEWVKDDQELADIFSIPLDKQVLKLDRLRGIDKQPIVYFISYFHPRVGLTGNEDFSYRLYEMLEKEYHTVVTTSKEEIRAMKADEPISEKLKIQVGDPILFRRRYVSDPGNRIVEYNLCYYRADRFTYSIEIERKSHRETGI